MANHKPIRHLCSYTAVVNLDRKKDNSVLTEEAGSFLVLSWSLPWGICKCRDSCGPQWNTVLVSIVKDILTQRKSLKWLPETEFHSFGSNTVHQYSQRLLHRTKHTTAFSFRFASISLLSCMAQRIVSSNSQSFAVESVLWT